MPELVIAIDAPPQVRQAAQAVRAAQSAQALSPDRVIAELEQWGHALRTPELADVPGLPFLRTWLRRGTLEPIVKRELGEPALHGRWQDEGRSALGVFAVGLVGHWPAGNVAIQPLLSLSCGLLGGNSALVRVPTDLREPMQRVMRVLAPASELLASRVRLLSFAHERGDLQAAMAQCVDGAMVWGSGTAVAEVRALPFASWAQVAVFGPRVSVAALDREVWGQALDRADWCQRIARDVWQFDQQACSSPQTLFLERGPEADLRAFVSTLQAAFEAEAQAHPRPSIAPALSSAICLARASWLMAPEAQRSAHFPSGPHWSLLVGEGPIMPAPTQGRTLSVMVVDDLVEALQNFDGMVQTLGLAVGDAQRERQLAALAASRGVDRIVKPGRMHVFGSPWDGRDLVRSMTRTARYSPSAP